MPTPRYTASALASSTGDPYGPSRLRAWGRATAATAAASAWPRNVAGNPDSPQAIVFLTSIVDVTVGS